MVSNTPSELTGFTSGYLSVLRPAGRSTKYGRVWVVECRCGKQFELEASSITKKPRRAQTGIPRSCGCYRKDNRSHLYKGVGDLSSTKWINIKKHADRKGLEFSITMDYAWKLYIEQDRTCALSGRQLTMSPSSMERGASTASLDRIDSTKGYVVGNVQWVHLVVNDLKSNMLQAEFVQWCRDVADYSY